ncbi:H-type small acid-soluble spore protein [Brevibacillus sp. B_LB10_24]|uniref:H-type small acid-soluble spore protein n=1 Tax=Brevibacillus sp. B_LB10_24 TaxID=3380645 RepID=UPI0038B7001D
MDTVRAEEIMASTETIKVECEGVPVWIDGVDRQTNTARVHVQNNPQEQKTVPVNQLIER